MAERGCMGAELIQDSGLIRMQGSPTLSLADTSVENVGVNLRINLEASDSVPVTQVKTS